MIMVVNLIICPGQFLSNFVSSCQGGTVLNLSLSSSVASGKNFNMQYLFGSFGIKSILSCNSHRERTRFWTIGISIWTKRTRCPAPFTSLQQVPTISMSWILSNRLILFTISQTRLVSVT